MPKYLTVAEAKQKLLELPDELADSPVIITKHGKPVMAAGIHAVEIPVGVSFHIAPPASQLLLSSAALD